MTLRLRSLPDGARMAIWRELRRDPLEIPIRVEDDCARVTIPAISAWNGGYLECQR